MGTPNLSPGAFPPTPRPVPPPSNARPRGRQALPTGANPAVRELEAAIRDEAVVRERALAVRLYLFFLTRRGLRRLTHYVAGSVVVIPLLNLALTPLGFDDLKLQVVLAAAFGTVMALCRPRGISVGFLLAATALATLVLAGYVHSLTDVLHVVLALLCYFGFGLALGIAENLVRHGE